MKVYAFSCKTPRFPGEIRPLLDECKSGSLICLPEYFLDGKEIYSGITQDHDLVVGLKEFASDRGVYIATGMVEIEGGKKHISGIFIDNSGTIIGKQRKEQPTSFEKKKGISGNSRGKMIATDFGTVSFAICKDQWYFNHRVEAEVLIHPRGFGLNHDQFGEFYNRWKMLDQTTAMLKKAYVIGVTGAYNKCPLADIVDFEGTVIDETTLEGSISAEINLKELRKYREGKKQSRIVPRF